MLALVRGYAAAALESAAMAGRLGTAASDLAGFARAVTSHARLREVLVDTGVAASLRVAIVSDILQGRAGPESSSLLRFAVRHEPAAELPLSIAELVELAETRAAVAGEVTVAAERSAGRTEVRDRIRGYAERVLQELTADADIDELEDELFRFARVVDAHPELRRVIGDPAAALSGRLAVLDDLLAGRARPATTRLIRYVLRAGHVRDLVGTFEWLVELAALERGRRLAEVRAAVELDPAERERLAVALGRLVDRPVEVRVVIDPSVIGGMLVSIGDLVIDGTVRLRLERLRDLLLEAR